MTDEPKKRFLFGKRSLYITIAAFLIVGSGYVYFRTNISFRQVVAGKVYCSRQPSPAELEKWITKYDLKTIINLRGHTGAETAEEVALAEKMHVRHISMHWSAGSTPPHYLLSKFISEMETCQKPMLIHCYSGIDRSGVAAALAAMAIDGENYYKAKRYSFVPPGPWKRKQRNKHVHISDLFVKFEDYCRQNDLVPDWPIFRKWAEDVYQAWHYYFFVHYSLPDKITLAPGQHYIVWVGITNRSEIAIPAEKREFKLFAYLGEAISKGADFKLIGPYTPLPREDIHPGEKIILAQQLIAPEKQGQYDVNLNIVSESGKTFEAKGSPIGTFRLIVAEPEAKK